MLLIWGIIIFRVVTSLGGGDDLYTKSPAKKYELMKMDTINYELSLSYRDPFYTSRSRKISTSNSSQKKSTNTKSSKKKTKVSISKVKWINLKYLGLVENSGTGVKRALIIVDGKYNYAEKGDEFNDFTLFYMNGDSVGLSHTSGERKYIKKKSGNKN